MIVSLAKGKEPEFYIKANAGFAHTEVDFGDFDNDVSRLELGLGMKVASWLSLEATRYDFEDAGPFFLPCPACNEISILPPDQYDLSGYSLSAKFVLNIDESFALFTHQGVAWHELEIGTPSIFFGQLETSDYQGSVGVEFRPSFRADRLAISLEWIRDRVDFFKADSLNVGARYTF